ncbi:alpha/beta fold hydrolase [Haloimpatiens sp. FM7330]|uniref:alpha/beta fold hydrolase n=1 Tax=Haloimpatiens sp. FM7330 TaxID=3298610 RepID=UPI00363AE9BF
MKFKTLGNQQKPVALFIHAMFITSDMYNQITELLKDDYYIVLPSLDGHDIEEHSTFYSAEDEADKIITYLKENNINNIKILLGVSLGGIIAFEVFRRNQVKINKVFLDGSPFIQLSQIRIKIMEIIFKKIAHKSAKDPNKLNILDKKCPSMAKLMKETCGSMSDETIKNLAHTCYTYQLPKEIKLQLHEKLTFLYGTKEKARVCIPTVKKYKNCNLIIKEGYSHCEFLMKKPVEYVKMLKQS